MGRPGNQTNQSSVLLGAVLTVFLGCDSGEMGTPLVSSGGSGNGGGSAQTPMGSGTAGADSMGSSGEVATTGNAGCGPIQGEGFAVGEISENWTLFDASGAEVQLHDYCGKVIYLEAGAEW